MFVSLQNEILLLLLIWRGISNRLLQELSEYIGSARKKSSRQGAVAHHYPSLRRTDGYLLTMRSHELETYNFCACGEFVYLWYLKIQQKALPTKKYKYIIYSTIGLLHNTHIHIHRTKEEHHTRMLSQHESNHGSVLGFSSTATLQLGSFGPGTTVPNLQQVAIEFIWYTRWRWMNVPWKGHISKRMFMLRWTKGDYKGEWSSHL